MKASFLALPVLLGIGVTGPAVAADQQAAPASGYAATVEPDAIRRVPNEHRKPGVVVHPATVRMIVPGMDKFSIYRLIGTPHFGEGITRRWNYVLLFPASGASTQPMRCRPRGRYNVVVSQLVWQEQACADRVASVA